MVTPEQRDLCLELFDAGAVRVGDFILKSGLKSPIYLDLRILVSHPLLLRRIARLLKNLATPLPFDRIAAIPYAAMPIGTALSLETGWPMVYSRKETKEYGTKKKIEGDFKQGETVLVIDDLITTGESKFEAIAPLQHVGLKVKDIVVLIDREQGGKELLKEKGYVLHSVLTISQILGELKNAGKISDAQLADVHAYFSHPETWSEKK